MAKRQLVTSQQLTAYFEPTRRDAQSLLPLLVRKLILATADSGTLGPLGMPAGDDIRLPGWDGRVELSSKHPYVPERRSAWEMGTAADPRSKATSDFKKRTTDPGGIDPATTTFVFVTPLVWSGKDAWTAERIEEKSWLDVRVIDGEVLSEWLDLAPTVAAWLHRECGAPIDDIDDPVAGWRRVIPAPLDTRVSPRLVIGGRTNQAEAIAQWLQWPDGRKEVSGESAEEVAAFVLAVARSPDLVPPESGVSSRLLLARGRDAVHYLGALRTPHLVIAMDAAAEAELEVVRLGHIYVLAPLRGALGPPARAEERIDLPPLSREVIAEELERVGKDVDTADRIARESKGSLQAVLWGLGQRRLTDLLWLQSPARSDLAPLVLARQWTVLESQDHDVIAALSGRSYAEVRAVAERHQAPAGPLLARGPVWDWLAWQVAWEYLAPSFNVDLISRFRKVAVQVLGARDPAIDLPPEERGMAAILKKTHPYSGALRDGIVASTALFGTVGRGYDNFDGPSIAGGIVRQLLAVEPMADAWVSLAPWLPDLAEASPAVFLEVAERIPDDDAMIKAFFREQGMFNASSPHVYLLWALERLAWSPDYLVRTLVLLGRLAERDPGGNLSNRPSGSLRVILLPWIPQTSASVAQRLAAFDTLRQRCPDAAWRCGLALLPRDHDTSSPSDHPRFHTWHVSAPKHVPPTDYFDFLNGLTDRLLDMVGTSAPRWVALTSHIPSLLQSMPEKATAMIERFASIPSKAWNSADSFTIGEHLRAIVRRHQEFPDVDWTMKGEELARFEQLAEKFPAATARKRHRWLFEPWPRLPRTDDMSFEEHDKLLAAKRVSAAQDVMNEEGIPGLLQWAGDVTGPAHLGVAMAQLDLDDTQAWSILEQSMLAPEAADSSHSLRLLGHGFIRYSQDRRGGAWAENGLRRVHRESGVEVATRWALAMATGIELWNLLDSIDPPLAKSFWSKVNVFARTIEEAEFALPRFLAAGRPYAALHIANAQVHVTRDDKLGLKETERALGLCLEATNEIPEHDAATELGTHELSYTGRAIAEVLDFIETHAPDEDATRQRLVKWEWAMLAMIDHASRGPRVLHREISRSPELFVDLLQLVYRDSRHTPEEARKLQAEEDEATAEQSRLRSRQAYEVLHAWRIVPGLDIKNAKLPPHPSLGSLNDSPTQPAALGSVDERELNTWVDSARRLATECGRGQVCDSVLAQAFVCAPADADGAWPCGPVRRCIERLSSEPLERGLRIELHNRRGVHYVGKTGADERALRDQYNSMAERIAFDAPRVAAILRAVADDYESEARRRDDDGTQREFDHR